MIRAAVSTVTLIVLGLVFRTIRDVLAAEQALVELGYRRE